MNQSRLLEIKEIALEIAQKSTCKNVKNGAVIFSNLTGIIQKVAYSTSDNNIHVEMKILAYMAGSDKNTMLKDIMLIHAPCVKCAALLKIAGISKVYYLEGCGDLEGIKFLEKFFVKTAKI